MTSPSSTEGEPLPFKYDDETVGGRIEARVAGGDEEAGLSALERVLSRDPDRGSRTLRERLGLDA